MRWKDILSFVLYSTWVVLVGCGCIFAFAFFAPWQKPEGASWVLLALDLGVIAVVGIALTAGPIMLAYWISGRRNRMKVQRIEDRAIEELHEELQTTLAVYSDPTEDELELRRELDEATRKIKLVQQQRSVGQEGEPGSATKIDPTDEIELVDHVLAFRA